MFIDLVQIKLTAGKGGDGFVSFRKEKYVDKGGPDGGDGGRGGNIVFKASKDQNTLADLRLKPFLEAEDGQAGYRQKQHGRNGQDLIVEVPIGTIVFNQEDLIADLTVDGQEVIVARGGDGGFGNAHFKSSTRQAPRVAEKGEAGEEFEATVELKLLADVGLVGLPNAGKSTFLSVVTNAKPEIANYEFTTLTPNLGVADLDDESLLIADIPGLIEGASDGKGLGIDFLRHIERTSVLLHLIDIYADDVADNYKIIRREINNYGDLANRPEIIALTKSEGFDQELIDLQINNLRQVVNKEAKIFVISSQAKQNLKSLLYELKQVVLSTRQSQNKQEEISDSQAIPTITLNQKQLDKAWRVILQEGHFLVSGHKIEKFGRRTDFDNPHSLNRLRDIMKKMGITRELIKQGVKSDSKIKINRVEQKFTFEEYND